VDAITRDEVALLDAAIRACLECQAVDPRLCTFHYQAARDWQLGRRP
jgi:hypothetical protein